MPQQAPQFTPRQLLWAGRRAESEGRLDLALRFYDGLTHHYGETGEAAEGRQAQARVARDGGRLRERRHRPIRVLQRDPYRLGRLLAAVFSGLGWLLAGSALLVIIAALAAETGEIATLQGLAFGLDVMPQAAGVLLAGAVALLFGQSARALFDRAAAARGLLAIERASRRQEHP